MRSFVIANSRNLRFLQQFLSMTDYWISRYLQQLIDKICNFLQQPVGKIGDFLPQAIAEIHTYYRPIDNFRDIFQWPIDKICIFFCLNWLKKIQDFFCRDWLKKSYIFFGENFSIFYIISVLLYFNLHFCRNLENSRGVTSTY